MPTETGNSAETEAGTTKVVATAGGLEGSIKSWEDRGALVEFDGDERLLEFAISFI